MALQLEGFSQQDSDMLAMAIPRPEQETRHATRNVLCFDCRTTHSVSRASISTLCPACSCYMDLRDIVITDSVQERIRTRGDVIVEKRGSLAGSSITCGNLTIYGEVQGSIFASGTIHFRNSGRYFGEIRCTQLIIDKKCQLQFQQPIHAESAEILGAVTGRFMLAKRLLLGPKSSLTGSVEAKYVSMPPGAKVNGPLVINPNPKVNLYAPPTEEHLHPALQPAPLATAEPEPPPELTPPASQAQFITLAELIQSVLKKESEAEAPSPSPAKKAPKSKAKAKPAQPKVQSTKGKQKPAKKEIHSPNNIPS